MLTSELSSEAIKLILSVPRELRHYVLVKELENKAVMIPCRGKMLMVNSIVVYEGLVNDMVVKIHFKKTKSPMIIDGVDKLVVRVGRTRFTVNDAVAVNIRWLGGAIMDELAIVDKKGMRKVEVVLK